jgi:hypothetical protein
MFFRIPLWFDPLKATRSLEKIKMPRLEVKIKLWSMKKVIALKQMKENKNLLEMVLLSQKLSKKKQQNSVLLI